MDIQVNNQYQGIIDKTVLLRVNFRLMGNTRSVSTEILNAVNAAKLLKIQKNLFESKELKAISKADGQMRQTLYDLCVPYDLGVALLPRDLIVTARAKMADYRETRSELVEIFIKAYPDLCDAQKTKMKALATELMVPFELLWKGSDYPDTETVRSKFAFSWDFLSLTIPEELKIAGKYESESAKLEQNIAFVAHEITAVMRQGLLDLVAHLKDALEPSSDGKPKRLFATAVTNIQEFLDTFQARNITNDTDLQALVDEVKKVISPSINSDMLKKDESLKDDVHNSMAEISSKLATLVENVPGRKFRGAGASSVSVPEPEAVPEEVTI